MILRRIISAPKSAFGAHSVQLRTKMQPLGGWGYGNFGHQPNIETTGMQIVYALFLIGFVFPQLDWGRFWPIISDKILNAKKEVLPESWTNEDNLNPDDSRRRPFAERFW